jgi:arginine/lysine/ornithine decarboxylase
LSFSIPAHAGGRRVVPEAARWCGMEAFRADLPMSHGLDTRDRAWGLQKTAQELFSEAVGADETLFSTNGITPAALEAALDANPQARGAMIFTPTYYGVAAPRAAASRGAPGDGG